AGGRVGLQLEGAPLVLRISAGRRRGRRRRCFLCRLRSPIIGGGGGRRISIQRRLFGRLRIRRQELQSQPPEDVVRDRFGDAYLRVGREAAGLEARMGELLHQGFQWHPVLQGQRGHGGNGIHEAGNGGPFLAHGKE